MDKLNLEIILCITGIFFGTVSQLLVWGYMISCVRLVAVPEYSTFRTNVNLAFLFSQLVLSFLYLTRFDTAGELSGLLMVIHLGLWMLTLLAGVLLMAFHRYSRDYLKSAVLSCLFKLVLAALALWIIL